MSVAYDYSIVEVPALDPPRRHLAPVPDRPASAEPLPRVAVLHPPREMSGPRPLRLTARGRAVLALAVAVLGALLVLFAALSSPSTAARHALPAAVTVQPGDTLWGIATRLAPNSDPGALVARLERRNHLVGENVVPGEVLLVR